MKYIDKYSKENPRFSQEKVKEYIAKNKLAVDPDFVMDYWGKKEWLTLQGTVVSSLAAAVHVCNSIYLTRKRKDASLSKNQAKKAKWLNSQEHYAMSLMRSEWKAFRQFIFVVRGESCEICGKKSNIQVHHKEYINGRKAWEYLPNEVMVLCASCHKRLHDIP